MGQGRPEAQPLTIRQHQTWRRKVRPKPRAPWQHYWVKRVSDRFVWAEDIAAYPAKTERFSHKVWREQMELQLEAREWFLSQDPDLRRHAA